MDFTNILKNNGLRKTEFRIELLHMFTENNSSLSVEEIKKNIKSTQDKVTIYRALEAFENAGLIHKVPNKKNVVRYALCHSDCSPLHHNHNHAHFICNTCNDTFCVEDISIPPINSIKGFKIQHMNLTLEGICEKCQSA